MILEGQGSFAKDEATTITHDQQSMLEPSHRNSSILPMASSTLELPCAEVSRCYVTEKEHGMRLTLRQTSKKGGDEGYEVEFSKPRNKNNEWYVRLDTTSSSDGTPIRTITLRHVVTGKYLHAMQDGSVSFQDFPSNWTTWLMEPAGPAVQSRHSTRFERDEMRSAYYSLLPKAFGPKKLAYTTNNRVDGSGLKLHLTDSSEAAVFEFEFTSGELCFVSNPVMHSYIRCNMFGKLSLSPVAQGWEVFRFIEVGFGHVAISSWTHSHKFLSSDPDGGVFTSENRLGYWEKWALEKTDNGVYIRSVAHAGRYLSVGRADGEAFHTTTKPGDFAKWHFDAAHSHVYFLTSIGAGGMLMVSSRRKGPFLSRNRRSWEEWKLERTPEGYITLWSKAHAKFLGCNSNGEIHTTSSKGNWSLWEMDESPHGGVYLKSKDHQRNLAVVNESLCTTFESFTEAETFRLEPRLPATISGPKLAALGAAGAVGIALTVAMPYAVLGAMEAAGMAAAELSVLGGISTVSGGALLGAGVVGTTNAVVKDDTENPNLSPTNEVKDDYIGGVQRPISAWRNW